MNYSTILQLLGVDGQPVGIYAVKHGTPHKVVHDLQKTFNEVFAYAEAAESTLFLEEGENLNLLELVDEELEKLGIVRLFLEEVTTDVI